MSLGGREQRKRMKRSRRCLLESWQKTGDRMCTRTGGPPVRKRGVASLGIACEPDLQKMVSAGFWGLTLNMRGIC